MYLSKKKFNAYRREQINSNTIKFCSSFFVSVKWIFMEEDMYTMIRLLEEESNHKQCLIVINK